MIALLFQVQLRRADKSPAGPVPAGPFRPAVVPPPPPYPPGKRPLNSIYYALPPHGTLPRVTFRIEPIIPATAASRISGVSIVEVLVNERGDAESVRVLRRLRPDVDAAVEAAVRQWRFQPARDGEKPVAVMMTVTVTIK